MASAPKNTSEALRPWSISKAGVAHQCGLRFHLKYVIRSQDKREIIRPEGRIGKAAHDVQERVLRGEPFDKAFKSAVIREKLTRNEMLEAVTYKTAIQKFTQRFSAWAKKFNAEKILLEHEVSILRDLTPCDYWDKRAFFRGVWDVGVLLRAEDGLRVVILDHKTGAPKELSVYEDQLNSYLVTAYALYPELVGAQTAIHWLQAANDASAIDWGPFVSTAHIKETLVPWFLDHLDTATTKGLTSKVPVRGWYCGFCEFQHVCPLNK